MGVYDELLEKVKVTKNQHDISQEERKKNIKNAFAVKDANKVIGKSILLVDDIFTTGSTVNECSKMLMKSGATEVFVMCIAVVKKRN